MDNPAQTENVIPSDSTPASSTGSEGAPPQEPHQQPPTGGQTAPTQVGSIAELGSSAKTAYDGFDPAIHATNPDGTPKATAKGGWAKKRGRKPGTAATASTTPAPAQAGNSPTVSDGPKIDNRIAAKMLAGCSVAGLTMVFGPEWDTDDKNEQKALVDSIEAYLEATGGMDASPAVGLLFSYGAYAMPRLTMPETQSRLKRFASWLGGMFKRKQ